MISTAQFFDRVIRMAAPLAGGRFLYSMTTFVGVLLLSYLGAETLAGSALISATQVLVVVVASSPLFVSSAIIGRHYGAGETEKVGHVTRQVLLLACCISLPVMVVFYHIDTILIYLDQDPVMVGVTTDFYHVYIWGIPALMFCNGLQQFFMGINRQQLTFYSSLLNMLVFILSAHLLTLGGFGFEGLGVKGLALSNILSFGANLIFLFLHAFTKKKYVQYNLFKMDFSQTQYIIQIFKLGLPFLIQITSELSAYFFAVIIVGWISQDALAVTQVITQYSFLLVVPIFGLSQATAVLVSHVVGAGRLYELRPLVRVCLLLGCGIMGVASIAFIFFPHAMAAVFFETSHLDRHDLFELLRLLFFLKILDLCFDAMRNILTGALRGLYDTKTAMFTSIFSNWVCGIPLGYLFAIPLKLGVEGIYFSFLLGNFLSAYILYRRWKKLTVAPLSTF